MLSNIVFIDDDETVKRTYKRKLQRIFGKQYSIECPTLKRELEDMLVELDNIQNKESYFIDENLIYGGIANFQGTELIEKIRVNEPKIPIYILTSDLTNIDEKLGDIEFAIDKSKWDEEKSKYAQRFLRHIDIFRSIKTKQAQRFDELFEKYLSEALTEEEKNEYNELNVIRSKPLINEQVISKENLERLDYQSHQLEILYAELLKLKEGL